MAYLGKTPSQAVRSRYYFTASGGETSLSPSEVTGLSFTDANYVDVSLNGVALVSGTDYTATPSTNTISSLSALTASDVVEIVVYDTFSVFGGNVNGDFNISGGTLAAEAATVTSLTTTGDINFGDNDKAVFGAGSDLQIYHDGNNSLINDLGTGDLRLRSNGSGVIVEMANGNDLAQFLNGSGEAKLMHNGSEKLATTSTGVDVTGTVTADGLTVDASSVRSIRTQLDTRSDSNASVVCVEPSANNLRNLDVEGQQVQLCTNAFDQTASLVRLRAATNGDILFYADDGTTTGLFWDASTQRLGLGTTSPATALDLAGEINFTGLTSSFPSPSQPRLYRSGSSAGSYPFNNFGHLVIQARGDGSNRDIVFATGTAGANKTVITSAGDVGIGTSSPNAKLDVEDTAGSLGSTKDDTAEFFRNDGTYGPRLQIRHSTTGTDIHHTYSTGASNLTFSNANTERMRIDGNGNLLVGTTDSTQFSNSGTGNDDGVVIAANAYIDIGREGNPGLYINRTSNDGILVSFSQDGTQEGTISVSGGTVSYNGGHLARWSQATDGNRITGLVKGTVMTNLDQMAVWSHDEVLWTADDELPDGVSVGDVKNAAFTEDNEQLNCMAVSSVEGDANVAGVFVNWDDDDTDFTADMNVAMTGDIVIRIAQGTTVARGDLLMSAGDGTAKPQGDDIVRSKTIAKVTSTNVSHTYDDGSYLVPCVLMAC